MSLKVLGALLLMFCGGFVGLSKKKSLRRNALLLEQLESSLAYISAEIALCCRPLPEIFEYLSTSHSKAVSGFYSSLVQKCESMSAGEAWDVCCRELELPEDALRALCSVSSVLGVYDGERQSSELEMLRISLGNVRNRLTAEMKSRAAGYPALGACLAGIFAMMII